MEPSERLAERGAMLDARPPHPQAFEEGDERRRPTGKLFQRVAVAVADGEGAGDAARREMLHQRQEVRQVFRANALLVQRQDVAAALGVDQIVGVLHALGDALERGQRADGVACDEGFQLFVGDVGIDGHL